MKIALICPSNILYMPYIKNYEKILLEEKIDFDIYNWDRLKLEEVDMRFKYRDSKIGLQRNYFDYRAYRDFIIKRLNESKYDKVIVFGIQLSFFLNKILKKRFVNNFILDIRDFNKIKKIFRLSSLINKSNFTVISSNGFKEWLPYSEKYIVNHNTTIESSDELDGVEKLKNDVLNVSYIGSLRDLEINLKFVKTIKDNNKFNVFYHGEGIINDELSDFLLHNKIQNVTLTGKYLHSQERELYSISDFVNVLIPNNDLNSRTLLPNRIYNAAIYGKPVIAISGTYLARQVEKYKLGIVIQDFHSLTKDIINYVEVFDIKKFDQNRTSFIEDVIKENRYFKFKIKQFIGAEYKK